MTGLILIVDYEHKLPAENESLLNSMARAITHESWHKVDTFSEPPFYVARVHLGIENAEPQPLFNEDKSICVIMDGAVFGYDQEKQKLEVLGHKFKVGNDPEFCLHLYEEYGEKFIEKLNGSFVLVIYDKRDKRIIIANDRHGLLPFYYTKGDDRCIFLSEVKAILEDKTFKKEIDHQAVADFFAFGRIFGNKTLLKGIKLLPPSSIVTWSKGKISEKTYWDFKFEEDGLSLSEEYYVDALVSLFKKAVWRRTRGKHRLGVFLSGGLDSRTTVGAIDKKCYPISTFTYGIRGGDEARIAERVAEKLGTEHKFVEMRKDYLVSFAERGVFLTDGMLNCAHFHWFSVLPEARKKVDVMFHGLGLDILLSTVMSHSMYASFFGGGSGLLLEREMSKAKEDVFSDLLYKFFNSLVPEEMMPLFFSKTYYTKIKGYPRQSFEKHLSTVKEKDPVNKLDSFWLRFFGRYNLSRVILRNYCEDRVPGVDNDFFEFALRVPSKFRFRYQELYFKFLAKLAPDLARIPYQRTGVAPIMPILAHRIGFLTKGSYKFIARKLRAKTRGLLSLPERIGYPDYGEWIRKDAHLRAFFEDVLLDSKTLNRGYFNGPYITRMVKEHISGKKDWTACLCALITFELWNRLFID